MAGYKLGGKRHLPGCKDMLGSANYFSYVFGDEVDSDEAAIRAAGRILADELRDTRPGELMGATLWQGDRVVKDFPDSQAEQYVTRQPSA